MRQLKLIKTVYSGLTAGLIILGLALLSGPKITSGFICKLVGMTFLICGMIRIVSYFTKDMFQLAFQFDLGLGIVAMVIGLVMLLRAECLVEATSAFIGIFILIDATLKVQTAIEAKRFGIQKWWIILGLSLVVIIVGILLITMQWETTEAMIRLIGMNLCFHGLLNLWVIQNTVKIIRRNDI
nr:DUF308 domain-containing protein [uncultured Cellulosilyticum sp.]